MAFFFAVKNKYIFAKIFIWYKMYDSLHKHIYKQRTFARTVDVSSSIYVSDTRAHFDYIGLTNQREEKKI
jgi:hypothetical protein